MTKNIPTSMHEVTDQWLIDILSSQQAFADDPISSVDRQSVGDGIGQVGEFNKVVVTTESSKQTTLFLKLRAPIEGMHAVALRYKMYEKEVRFYNELAAQMDVRTPEVYYADYDPETENVALLMEFLDGWHSPDQITGASHNQTLAAIKQLAAINTPYWNRTQDLPWLPTMQTDYMQQTISDMAACSDIFFQRFCTELPISKSDFDRIIESWPAILDGLSEGNLTLTHYDYRVENMFFSSDESEVAVIDWQLIGALRAGWDLAYLIGTNIPSEQRRANEQQYIDLYLDCMRDRGVDYSEAELRHDMKWSLLGLCSIAVIGGANFDVSNPRSFELFKVISIRLFDAIADHEALSVIS
jgi:aminoglycoside phosphotransferase (APT) family kinase protein